jgi:hypothetical protein
MVPDFLQTNKKLPLGYPKKSTNHSVKSVDFI